MNDTHNLLPLKATVATTAGNFDATLAFSRVTPNDKESRRRNLSRGSLNPMDLSIQHYPRTAKQPNQRSLVTLETVRSRVDALSNVIGTTVHKVSIQSNIPADLTLAEYIDDLRMLLGFLLGNSNEGATETYQSAT